MEGRDLAPQEWKGEVHARFNAAAGARKPERFDQHFTCGDCGEGFDRSAPRSARKPTRCPPCAKTHALEYGRAYREAHKEDPR